MSEKKPTPDLGDRARKRCPVCGEPSFSAAGVHPQCSAKKADAERSLKLKKERLAGEAKKAENKSTGPTSWQKACPNCKAILHVRKSRCECGHQFTTK